MKKGWVFGWWKLALVSNEWCIITIPLLSLFFFSVPLVVPNSNIIIRQFNHLHFYIGVGFSFSFVLLILCFSSNFCCGVEELEVDRLHVFLQDIKQKQ